MNVRVPVLELDSDNAEGKKNCKTELKLRPVVRIYARRPIIRLQNK